MSNQSDPQTSTIPQTSRISSDPSTVALYGKRKKERKPLVSPSSSFVDFSDLKSEIYSSGDRINNAYDPYSQRTIRKPITDLETVVHLLKGCMGAGMLAMPKAFYYAGSGLGTIGTLLLSMLCVYGIHVLLRMKYMQCKWLYVPFLALPRSMKVAFMNGPPPFPKLAWTAPILTDFFLVVNQIGLCATYITFISKSFKRVMEPSVFEDMDIRLYMLILFFPMLFINYIRNLKRLSFISLLGDVLMAGAICLCFYYIFAVGPWAVNTPGEIRMVAPVNTWPLFISITMFSVEAVGVMITLEHNMKKPDHFLGYWGLFPWCMMVIVMLYTAVGLGTYLKYGENTGETMVSNLPSGEWLSNSCQIMIALSIFGTYPIQLYVGLEIIWGNYLSHHIKNRDLEYAVEYGMRTVIVLITFVIAFIIPQIDLVVSLVGAFCLSVLALIIPFLLELCTRYPQYGCGKYILIKDIIFTLIGFCIMLVGSCVAIKAIVDFIGQN